MQFFRFRHAFVGAMFAAHAVQPAGAQDSTNSAAPPPPTVGVQVMTPSIVSESEQFNGRVEAEDKVELRARSAGFVQALNFEEGGTVSQGDVLFEIEPDAYEAAVTQIQGQIQSAEAEKTLAQIEVDRQQTLFDRGTSAENVLQQAQAELGKAQGTLTQLQGALRQAELNLSYTKIIAPFDGRIGFTEVDVGAFVGPESGGLVTISSMDPMFVSFPVAEARILNLRHQGADSQPAAEVTLANGETYDQQGDVIAADATINTGTDTLLVRAEFPNPDSVLIDGQLVRIQLTASGGTPVLSFPLQALQRDQEGYFVMIVNSDSKVEKRIIEVDRFSGTLVVPKSGLDEGDEVITQGLQRVRVGMKVQAQQVPPPGTTPTGDGSGNSSSGDNTNSDKDSSDNAAAPASNDASDTATDSDG